MKFKLIKPEDCSPIHLDSKKCPECVIEFVPCIKRNVGIGWVTEGPATAADFKKYPVLVRPWINPEKFNL